MMHLCKLLVARGIIATFVNTQVNHERLIRSQPQYSKPGSAQEAAATVVDDQSFESNLRLVSVPDGLSAEDYVANDVVKMIGGMNNMEGLLEDLILKSSPPITCIIGNVFLLSTPNLAKKLNIPHIAFWTQSAASYAIHLIFTQGYYPPTENHEVNGEAGQDLLTYVPGCPPLKSNEIPTFLQPRDLSDFIFRISTECFERIHESAFVILNTYAELESSTLEFIKKKDRICEIGPLLPSEFFSSHSDLKESHGTALWAEDYGCLQWLNQQEPSSVLYVAFGSIAVVSIQQMHEFAKGLEASQVPILMVVRPSLMSGDSPVFPQGFFESMKDRSCFVAWAPQLHVLSHRAVGGFLTHAGWNSTLESISSKVPMLCWPYYADQMMGCRCIVDAWRVGLELRRDEKSGMVLAKEVEDKVRTLMSKDMEESKALRDRVAKLGDAAKAAVLEEGGSSRTNFEALLNYLNLRN